MNKKEKLSSKSKHKQDLRKERLKNLAARLKSNIKKRKIIKNNG